jgi:capsular exopolysaccharide synthesis family protein
MTKAAEEKKTHLREYWRLVYQSRWTVLSIAIIVTTMVALATFLQTEIYRATAAVEVQPRSKSISPNADFSQIGASSWNWSAEDKYINTQLEVIRSKGVAQETLEREGLVNDPRFKDLPDPAGALTARMTLRVLPETYIVELSVDDPDPAMATLLANGVAKAYIAMNVTSAVANARQVIEELGLQIKPIQQEIADKELERLNLSKDANLYTSDAQGTSIGARIAQLESELTSLQIRLGERESILKAIDEIEAAGGSYESLPVVANDKIIIGLKEEAYNLEQELEEMSAAFRAGHPKTVAARSALAEVPRKIGAEAERIISKTRTEYAVDKRREQDLREQLQRTRSEGLGLSETQSRMDALDAEIRELRRIYELITTRIKEIDLNQNTIINNLRIHELATEPTYPVRPRKVLNLAAGLLLGLFLGVGSAFFIDYLDNTIRNSEDIERYLNLPLLAMVPRSDDHMAAAVQEAMQTLRTSILFASKGRTLKSVLVTSAGPGEGKSRTAVNLARTLANGGDRVLLVDADLRRPTVHKHLNLLRDGGVTNYMMGREGGDTWRHLTKKGDDNDNLDVLTCGPLPPKPVELFGAERFSDLIAQLRREYHWVIIDSPPVASLADTLVLGTLAEMTVVVIQHKKNDRELVLRSVDQLRNVDANLVGAVLNAVDLRHVGYGDQYYAAYTYTHEPEEIAESSWAAGDKEA